MYKIILNNEILALCDKPRYIKKHTNGSFIQTELTDATGVAVGGAPYTLLGHELDGTMGTVVVQEIDTGEMLLTDQTNIAVNTSNLDYIAMMSDIELPGMEEDVTKDPTKEDAE